jgi:hypothetical protein
MHRKVLAPRNRNKLSFYCQDRRTLSSETLPTPFLSKSGTREKANGNYRDKNNPGISEEEEALDFKNFFLSVSSPPKPLGELRPADVIYPNAKPAKPHLPHFRTEDSGLFFSPVVLQSEIKGKKKA